VVAGSQPIVPGREAELGFDGLRAHLFRADGTALERRIGPAVLNAGD
jgi:hypothetical protein